MLSGMLVYSREGARNEEGFIERFLEEANKVGMKLDFFYREDLYVGIENGRPYVQNNAGEKIVRNFAIVRCVDPIFTRQLELLGMKTFNSAVVSELCNDKAKTHQVACMLGIPTADSLYLGTEQTPNYKVPYVAKSRNGSGGLEVCLVENEASFEVGKYSFAQSYVNPGKEVRAFVLGKELLGAVIRTNEADFRSNEAFGGKVEPYRLDENELNITERLVRTFEFGLVAIDFIFENGNAVLNEIEDVVPAQSIEYLTEIDLPNQFLKFIKSTLMGS